MARSGQAGLAHWAIAQSAAYPARARDMLIVS